MAARKTAWTPKKVRERIRVGLFLNRLRDHVLGKVEMTASQVHAATYLISQAIGKPAQAIEHSGSIGSTASELRDDELQHIARRGSAGAVEETRGETKPAELH